MTGTKNGSRVDLHCHSAASAVAKLGVQQALGLPECATPPAEVRALAKRRGMDWRIALAAADGRAAAPDAQDSLEVAA